jgi:RNA polymerase sigma factor for flagellar operon FliA
MLSHTSLVQPALPHPRDVPAAPAAEPRSRQDPERRTAMILEHLRLVSYATRAATRYAAQGAVLDPEDVLAFGIEGLIEAVDSFEPQRGFKFSTWAVLHIRTSIQDALRALDPLPRGLRARAKQIERTAAELAHAHGVWPSLHDLAVALGLEMSALRRTLQLLDCTEVSLNLESPGAAGAEPGAGCSLLDALADDDPEAQPETRLLRRETRQRLREAIARLPAREAVVIDAYYRQGRSMQTIGAALGVSTTRVSQIHARALALLRAQLDDVPAPVTLRQAETPTRRRRQASARGRRLARQPAA